MAKGRKARGQDGGGAPPPRAATDRGRRDGTDRGRLTAQVRKILGKHYANRYHTQKER